MIDQLLSMKTNELIIYFTLNNIVLLVLIHYTLKYICKKTPWAIDDDLPSFFGGAIDLITKRKGGGDEKQIQPDPAVGSVGDDVSDGMRE